MKSHILLLAALAFAAVPAPALNAQHAHPAPDARAQTASREGPVGTLIVAHGGGPEWDQHVHDVAGMVRTGGPVEVSFLMGPGAAGARFQDAARKLVEAGAAQIVVVPVLVSSHSGHYEQIRYLAGETDTLGETMMHHLHMAGIERPALSVPVRVERAIDDAPEAARVIVARALALAPQPEGRALFLVGHGPNSAEDNAAWMSNLRTIVDSVRAVAAFRDVRVGLVRDDAPAPVRAEAVRGVRELIQLQHELTGQPVVVVPVLISKGRVSRVKIPADLEGLPIVYSGETLLPHAEMARWIESRVASAAMTASK